MSIVLYPDVRLQQKCQDVITMQDAESTIQALKEEFNQYSAVGLAANQIDLVKSVAIILLMNKTLCTLVNPIVIEKHQLIASREGCLSIPKQLIKVNRYKYVIVQCLDRVYSFNSDEAIRAQHEIDHLNGLTILDKKFIPLSNKVVHIKRNSLCPLCGKKVKKCSHRKLFLGY